MGTVVVGLVLFLFLFFCGRGGVNPAKGEHTTLKWVRSDRLVILLFAIVCVIMPTDITHSEF